MTGARLTLALTGGGFVLPKGRIAVLAPRAGADLSALPQDRCHVVTGFKPDFDAFTAAGYACSIAPEGAYGAVLVCLPRAKAAAHALIEQARALTEGPVLVDGQKDDGIESILKECRSRARVEGPINKAHGKLFWFTGGDFTDWRAAPRQVEGDFTTAPGVFSADGIDPASRLLAEALPPLRGRVGDFGAGWGYLSAQLLAQEGITALALVEADHAALDCARANVADPRAVFHWADAREWIADPALDVVVMNPPFHDGRAADPELGRSFIRAAAKQLGPRGVLYLVANRHLGYEAVMTEVFSSVSELGGDRSFKLLVGERPTRQGARQGVGSVSGHSTGKSPARHGKHR